MYLVIYNQVTVEVQSLTYHLFKTTYLEAHDYRGLFSIFFFFLSLHAVCFTYVHIVLM